MFGLFNTEKLFPFDGACNLSQGADFTLYFEDRSFLKVDKWLLELASPALRRSIGGFRHNESLELSGTSKDAWILILNYIHPAGNHDKRADEFICLNHKDNLIDVLRQCALYCFVSLKQDLDRRVAMHINGQALEIEHWSKFCDRGCPATFQCVVIDRDMWFMEAIRMFELPKSEEALASFMMAALKENATRVNLRMERNMTVDRNELNTANNNILSIVKEMRELGRHSMCSLFAQKMMEAGFCFFSESLVGNGF